MNGADFQCVLKALRADGARSAHAAGFAWVLPAFWEEHIQPDFAAQSVIHPV